MQRMAEETVRNKSHIDIINLHEEVAKGYDSPWITWRCLNCLHTWYTCSNAQRKNESSTQETPHVIVGEKVGNHGTHVTVLPTGTYLLFG